MLRSKLVEIKEREHLEKKSSDIKGVQQKIEWGSQIRNYVFMPYTLAKDTRTGFENANINAVMDGDIDGFINAYLSAHPCESRFLYFLVWRRPETGDRFEKRGTTEDFSSHKDGPTSGPSFFYLFAVRLPYCYTYRLLCAGAT